MFYRQPLLMREQLYGMSTHPKAFRPHLIDPQSHVRVFTEDPSKTKYRIQWYCNTPSDRTPLRIMRTSPPGVDLCRACLEAKKNSEYWAARGVTRESIAEAHRDEKALRWVRATMRGYPMTVPESTIGSAPF